MPRICIAGGPRVGKTTLGRVLSERHGWPLRSTDDLMHLGWSESSEYAARFWLTLPGPWIVEGVAVPRALRKALRLSARVTPCDEIIVLRSPFEVLSPRQASMAKGVHTVLDEIRPELEDRGVVFR